MRFATVHAVIDVGLRRQRGLYCRAWIVLAGSLRGPLMLHRLALLLYVFRGGLDGLGCWQDRVCTASEPPLPVTSQVLPRPSVAFPSPTTQILFLGPEGAEVSRYGAKLDEFDSHPLSFPGRQNFPASGLYRLRVTNLPGRSGQEFFPTLELPGIFPRTEKYLMHNAVPIRITADELVEASRGTRITKVVYLRDPDPANAEATSAVETLVSNGMKHGTDPVIAADRLGTILAIVRIGPETGVTPSATMGTDPKDSPPDDTRRTDSQTLELDPLRGRFTRPLRVSQVGRRLLRPRRR